MTASDTPGRPLAGRATIIETVVVEHGTTFTLADLARACRADLAWLRALVEEGALAPEGDAPEAWRFAGETLQRARRAARLGRDFDLAPAQAALVLQLLDEIDALRARLAGDPRR